MPCCTNTSSQEDQAKKKKEVKSKKAEEIGAFRSATKSHDRRTRGESENALLNTALARSI